MVRSPQFFVSLARSKSALAADVFKFALECPPALFFSSLPPPPTSLQQENSQEKERERDSSSEKLGKYRRGIMQRGAEKTFSSILFLGNFGRERFFFLLLAPYHRLAAGQLYLCGAAVFQNNFPFARGSILFLFYFPCALGSSLSSYFLMLLFYKSH